MTLATAVVADVISGAPDQLEALAASLSGFATVAQAGVERLGSLTGGSVWVGEAAAAFAEIVDDVPSKLCQAAASFSEASVAVGAFAGTLRHAQRAVADAIDLYRQGQSQTASWEREWDRWRRLDEPDAPRPSRSDPGSWERAEAERIVERARAEVDDAAARARDRLHEAWRLAPDQPGFLSRAAGQLGQFGLGVWDSVWGLAELGWSMSQPRMMLDPLGFAADMKEMGEGILYGVEHPAEFAKAVTNWDMWTDNPARALGQLVPDIVIALATVGGGSAASASRRGAEALDAASDIAEAADTASDIARIGTQVGRFVDDPGILTGLSPDEVATLIPETWVRSPARKGEGLRYADPTRPGVQIIIEEGWPGGSGVHAGPYARISTGRGKPIRIPLAGNPELS